VRVSQVHSPMKSNRISVLHFSNEFVRGGAEQHMLTLLCGLSRTYFDLHLVCTPQLAQLLKPDLPPDVETLPMVLRKPWQLNVALQLAEILRSRQVDILHSHIFYASLFASPVAWSCSVPIVIETPHVREYWRRGRFTSRYIVDRLVGHCVNRYIAVSEANGRYLAEEKGLPNQKISVIHNGSDLKRFHHVRCKSEGLRQKFGFQKEELILLVAGRLEPQKGHAVLLTALPQVRRAFPNVRAVFAGEGALAQQLQQQVRELDLEGVVDFVGFQSNMEEWFSVADVTVLPSFYEGLPLSAIESLAAGTPVVATAVDGTPEIVIHEKTGLTVQPGDAKELARAICTLLTDPAWRAQLGSAGRAWVEEEFSQEKQIKRTEDLYLSSIEQVRRERVRGNHDSHAVGTRDVQLVERAG
jgi:glycosyltransferase involved in cell wall biosynthesis